jgi:hypothetical protein
VLRQRPAGREVEFRNEHLNGVQIRLKVGFAGGDEPCDRAE